MVPQWKMIPAGSWKSEICFLLVEKAWKREICFVPQSVTKSGTRHEKGKYVSLLKASESKEQGMKRQICFLAQSVRKRGTRHEKAKYVSLLKASESKEQGMKKANMFPSSKCNKVRNKAWKRQICFLPRSLTRSGTRHEKGKYVAKGSLRKTYSAPCLNTLQQTAFQTGLKLKIQTPEIHCVFTDY